MHLVSATLARMIPPTYPFCSHGNISGGYPPPVQSTFLRSLNSLEDTDIIYGLTEVIIAQAKQRECQKVGQYG